MLEPEYYENVNSRFPGVERLLDAGRDAVYMFLNDCINSNDFSIIDEYPTLVVNLEFDDPDMGMVMGSPSALYKDLSDLFEIMSRFDYDTEGAELDEDEDL